MPPRRLSFARVCYQRWLTEHSFLCAAGRAPTFEQWSARPDRFESTRPRPTSAPALPGGRRATHGSFAEAVKRGRIARAHRDRPLATASAASTPRTRERRDSSSRASSAASGDDGSGPSDEPDEAGPGAAGLVGVVQALADATTVAEAGVCAIERAGWAVLLAAPGTKRTHWRTPSVYDATRDAGLFEAWAIENPDAGLAVNLGASGLAAIEDDGPGGLLELAALEAAHGVLPATWEIQARRGRHRLFRAPCKVPSRKLGTKLELRSWGEYSLIPPTTVDAVTRRWIPASMDRPLALLPDWLASWAPSLPAGAHVTVASSPTLAALAVEEVTTRLALRPASPGTGRGTALFAASCSLGRHVHAGTLPREEAEQVLRDAGVRLRLTRYERDRSIDRGLRIGPERNAG